MSATDTALTIPEDLKPADGRFGCGPSKVRPAQLARLADGDGAALMGTSHRQKPVKDLVGQVRTGLSELFSLPEGYEVVLGNGGTTAFWDAATFGLVRERALHLTYGEFSLEVRQVDQRRAVPGGLDRRQGRARATRPRRPSDPSADVVAWAHNETSTGVMVPVERVGDGPGPDRRDVGRRRPAGRRRGRRRLLLRAAEVLRRRRRPVARADEPGGAGADRRDRAAATAGSPSSSRCTTALDNSLKDQTYNTPALATLILLADQLEWMLGLGGLDGLRRAHDGLLGRTSTTGRSRPTTRRRSSRTRPSARSSSARSTSTTTVDAAAVAKTLRANGIVDTEPYRKLGRNQLRVAMFPAIDPEDVKALTACIDYVVENL